MEKILAVSFMITISTPMTTVDMVIDTIAKYFA